MFCGVVYLLDPYSRIVVLFFCRFDDSCLIVYGRNWRHNNNVNLLDGRGFKLNAMFLYHRYPSFYVCKPDSDITQVKLIIIQVATQIVHA